MPAKTRGPGRMKRDHPEKQESRPADRKLQQDLVAVATVVLEERADECT